MKKKSNLVRFIPYFKKYKKELILDLLCAALTTGCEIALPLIVKKITEAVSDTPMSLTLELVLICGCIYIGLKIIDVAAYYYMATGGHVMGSKIETDMRRDLFKHLQKLSNSIRISNSIFCNSFCSSSISSTRNVPPNLPRPKVT